MKNIGKFALAGCVLFGALTAQGQSLSEKYKRFLTKPNGYVCYKTNTPIKVDGKLDEAAWKDAPYTEAFVDISGAGFPTPRYNTRAKMLWDDNYLYVAAEMEEPHVWADITKRDEVVFYNNDFEVFIDPTDNAHNYFEIETNAIGTVFDLSIEKPYRAPNRTHVQFQYNTPGMLLAAKIHGTLNKSKDVDKGWTVEMAIPRTAIAAEFDNYLKAGNYMRIGFSRVEWQYDLDKDGKYSRKKGADGKYLPEDNWTWGPTGQIAMHMPERWGYVYLSDKTPAQGGVTFQYPETYKVDRLLWSMFYAQEEQYAKHHKYFGTTMDFGLTDDEITVLPKGSVVKVEAISNKYEITVTEPNGNKTSIDESGLITRTKK